MSTERTEPAGTGLETTSLGCSVGPHLKTIRKAKGLTQEQIGVFIERSKAFVSAVEKGVTVLSEPQIKILAEKLAVNEKWLASGSGPMTENEATRDRRTIGERVYQIRREKQLSQSQFAALLGVSRNTISLLERRKISASPSLIRSVVEKCNVDEAWLRSGEESDLSFLNHPDMRRRVIAYLKRQYPEEIASPVFEKTLKELE